MLAQAMVLNIGELERVCLLRFVDRGSMKCNGSLMIELKDVLKDVLKDIDLANVWGESSPLYTRFGPISHDLAPG